MSAVQSAESFPSLRVHHINGWLADKIRAAAASMGHAEVTRRRNPSQPRSEIGPGTPGPVESRAMASHRQVASLCHPYHHSIRGVLGDVGRAALGADAAVAETELSIPCR